MNFVMLKRGAVSAAKHFIALNLGSVSVEILRAQTARASG
jgi:hypothetical protein